MKKFEKELAIELGGTQTLPYDDEYAKFLINDFVNDAMAKRDRSVSIYVGRFGVNIAVYPFKGEEE